MATTITYLVYIAISVVITVFVSNALRKYGKVFLIDGFGGNVDLATSVIDLLVMGFYLFSLGFVLLRMNIEATISGLEDAIVYLSSSLGLILLILGIAHTLNMFLIHKFRSSYRAKDRSLSSKVKAEMARNRAIHG